MFLLMNMPINAPVIAYSDCVQGGMLLLPKLGMTVIQVAMTKVGDQCHHHFDAAMTRISKYFSTSSRS